jgi:hypothetical protein
MHLIHVRVWLLPGKQGEVAAYHTQKGRFAVRLDDGSALSILPKNLLPADHAPAPQPPPPPTTGDGAEESPSSSPLTRQEEAQWLSKLAEELSFRERAEAEAVRRRALPAHCPSRHRAPTVISTSTRITSPPLPPSLPPCVRALAC